jgi:SAM-dependent methyltransferase
MDVNYSLTRLNSEGIARTPILNRLTAISKSTSRKLRVLELGCGNGRNLEIFQKDGHDVLGIDGLQDAVNACRTKAIPAKLGNLNDELNISEKWDLVIILDVLEHLERPEKLMFEAKEILADDGVLIINVPNHFTLQGRLRILAGSGIDSEQYFPECDEWNYPHLRFFTYKGIRKLVERTGYYVDTDFSQELLRYPNIRYTPGFLVKKIWGAMPINLSAGGFFLKLKRL